MTTHRSLDLAHKLAKEFLDQLGQGPVGSTQSHEKLRRNLDQPLPLNGMPADQVIQELHAHLSEGILSSPSGRMFAWVMGGTLPSALASDWLVSTWDQNVALAPCAPGVSVLEEVTGEWLKELFDLPREASFAFTTGCQMAHFTCLAAARFAMLQKKKWNVNEQGLFGAPFIEVITSVERHRSVDRALRFLGFGDQSISCVAVNSKGEISIKDFTEKLKLSTPKIVVLNAADLNIGAFDDFQTLIPLAQKHGAWVHIDGAFGLFARASQTYKKFTLGLELADSWATDTHKWLNVPYDCGFAIVKNKEAHQNAMSISASYITSTKQVRDAIDYNPEWSRRARAIPVYAALKELGKTGVADLIDRCCAHAKFLFEHVKDHKLIEILWPPTLNQGLMRFLSNKQNATEKDHDEKTQNTIEKINACGEAFFSSTVWRGKKAMRVSVVNWRTTKEDMERTAQAIKKALREE